MERRGRRPQSGRAQPGRPQQRQARPQRTAERRGTAARDRARHYTATRNRQNPAIFVAIAFLLIAGLLVAYKFYLDSQSSQPIAHKPYQPVQAPPPEISSAETVADLQRERLGALYRRAQKSLDEATELYGARQADRALTALDEAQGHVDAMLDIEPGKPTALKLRREIAELRQRANKDAAMNPKRQKLSEKDYARLIQGKEITHSRSSDPNWEGDGDEEYEDEEEDE